MKLPVTKMPERLVATFERMYQAIENDPQFLLMDDAGPAGETADVVVARLYGHDGQLDHEWRIDRAEPILRLPRVQRPIMTRDSGPDLLSAISANEYVLQSGFTRTQLAASGVDNETRQWIRTGPDPTSFCWSLLALRYQLRHRFGR